MFAKIIFLVFLIIALLSRGLCVRNEKRIMVERQSRTTVTFFPEDKEDKAKEPTVESRQDYVNNNRGARFTFPNEPESTDYNQNELPLGQSSSQIRPQVNINKRTNPYNPTFNTGEYHQRPISTNYPYSSPHYPNAIFKPNGNRPDVPNYRIYNDPNYYQNNYAQNYNYLYSKRPNYSRRPIPPPAPPYNLYQYQSASPYRTDPATIPPQGYPLPTGPQFNDLNPSFGGGGGSWGGGNPFANFFDNVRSPTGFLGGQFAKALEDIASNDDLECVPKLLCQMIGDPNRRAQLPGFLSSSAVTSLIAALPPSSPALVFGRAALLGFTGGEESCLDTYARCPNDEEDLLYYLNNHRGGFFRFFNGGQEFGEIANYEQDQDDFASHQHHQQHLQSGPSNSPGVLQSLGQMSGINLANLGLLANLASLVTSGNQGSPGNSIGQAVTSLLSGFTNGGQRSSKPSRKKIKRSIDDLVVVEPEGVVDEENPSKIKHKKYNDDEDNLKKNPLQNLTKITEDKTEGNQTEEIEGRVLNYGRQIYADDYNNYERTFGKIILFPSDDFENDNMYDNRKYNYYGDRYSSGVKFPINYNDGNRRPYKKDKRIQFNDDLDDPQYEFDDDIRKDPPYRNDMIFPDRTGTGNLRFDNNDYRLGNRKNRFGKILIKPVHEHNYDDDYEDDQPYYDRDRRRPYDYTSTRRPYYDDKTRRPYYDDHTRRPYYDDHTRRPYYDDQTRRPYYDDTTRRPYYDDQTTRRPYYDYTTRRPHYEDQTKRPYYDDYTTRRTTRRPYYDDYTRRPYYDNPNRYSRYTTSTTTTTTQRPYYPNRYQYESTTRRPSYDRDRDRNYYGSATYYGDRYRYTTKKPTDSNNNIYVTNSKGVVEYLINPRGEKIYV